MNRTARFLFPALLACAVLCARSAHAAPAPEILLERIYRFDIACTASPADPDKKICSQQKSRAFAEFMEAYADAKHKDLIKSEIELSKVRAAKLEALKKLAPLSAAGLKRLDALAMAVQDGDPAAARELSAAGADALPALLKLETARGVLPSATAIETLAGIENSLDMSDAALARLSAPARDALLTREQNYQRTLKRIVLVQQGAQRIRPPWFVFAYMFGIGFIPFAAGLAACVICLGRFDARAFALLLACYLAYAGTYAWFMFRAPFV